MPQVTLSVPREKLPLLKDMLRNLGIEDHRTINTLPKSQFRKVSRSVKDSANSLFQKYFSWEYNRNELEFE